MSLVVVRSRASKLTEYPMRLMYSTCSRSWTSPPLPPDLRMASMTWALLWRPLRASIAAAYERAAGLGARDDMDREMRRARDGCIHRAATHRARVQQGAGHSTVCYQSPPVSLKPFQTRAVHPCDDGEESSTFSSSRSRGEKARDPAVNMNEPPPAYSQQDPSHLAVPSAVDHSSAAQPRHRRSSSAGSSNYTSEDDRDDSAIPDDARQTILDEQRPLPDGWRRSVASCARIRMRSLADQCLMVLGTL